MDKKAVLGIDTVKLVIISLLILAMLAVCSILAVNQLSTVAEDVETKLTGKLVNETISVADTTGDDLTIATLRNCKFTPTTITNKTSSTAVLSTNYSIVNCKVLAASAGIGNLYGVDWNVSGSYTYNSYYVSAITYNISEGPTNFFKQAPTFFTLLAVVVLILIIAIVISVISRFGGFEGVGRGGISDEL